MNPVAATVTLTNGNGDFIASTTSEAATGNYRFEGLAVGAYEVTAVPVSSVPPLGMATGGAYVSANSQQEVNLTLDFGASITGKVFLPTGLGAAGVRVNAYLVGVNFPNERPSEPTATAVTNRSGTYTFPALGAVTLARLEVVPPVGVVDYKTIWYKTGSSWATAQVIPLEEGDQIAADPVTLVEGLATGSITGTAYTDGGFEAAGARVTSYSPARGKVGQTLIDDYGQFTLDGIPAGPVYIRFDTDPASEDYSFQERWYPEGTSQSTAELLTVTAGSTLSLEEVNIPRGGDLTVVTNDFDSGDPISGVTVTLFSSTGTFTGITNVEGRYVFKGLPTDNYRLLANPGMPHIPEWYDRTTSLELATDILIEEGYSSWASMELRTTPDGIYPDIERNPNRSFTLTWEPEVGADTVQIQRRLSSQRKWVTLVADLRGLTYTDSSKQALRASGACYRTKVTASTGARGPWTIICS